MRRAVRKVRRDAVAREVADGLYCLSVPVLAHDRSVCAAISVAMNFRAGTAKLERRLLALLRGVSGAVSRNLGAPSAR